MDVTSLIPNTDNLYKFLFVGGLLCIVFSIVYPMDKQHRIELEVNAYNKQVELFNKDISTLKIEVEQSKLVFNSKRNDLEKLYASKVHNYKTNSLENEIDSLLKSNREKLHKITTTDIVLKYEQERIKVLKGHIHSFSLYQWSLIVVGVFFTICGLRLWYRSTRKTDLIHDLEIRKREHEVRKLV